MLGPGSTIGIIGPAGPPDSGSIEKAVEFLAGQGLSVKLAKSLFCSYGYLAGTDQQRADDINQAFKDLHTDAILVARGGFGSNRLLHLLNYDAIRENPKPLIGYSDPTGIQLAMLVRSGVKSYYGPLAASDLAGPSASFNFRRLIYALNAGPGDALFAGGWPKHAVVLAPGSAEGVLIGGCLAVLVSLVGTDYFPRTEGSILFLEDVDEEPYRIDLYLTQLRLSGVLSSVSGVLLGQFARCRPRRKKPSFTLNEVITQHLADRGCPVVANLPFGHIKRKATIPQGVRISLDTAQKRISII